MDSGPGSSLYTARRAPLRASYALNKIILLIKKMLKEPGNTHLEIFISFHAMASEAFITRGREGRRGQEDFLTLADEICVLGSTEAIWGSATPLWDTVPVYPRHS